MMTELKIVETPLQKIMRTCACDDTAEATRVGISLAAYFLEMWGDGLHIRIASSEDDKEERTVHLQHLNEKLYIGAFHKSHDKVEFKVLLNDKED